MEPTCLSRASALGALVDAVELLLTGSGPRIRTPATKSVAMAEYVMTAVVRFMASPRSSLFGVGLIKARTQSLGQFYGIVIRPKMHEEQARLFLKHMAVDGGDLNAVLSQRPDYRIDF